MQRVASPIAVVLAALALVALFAITSTSNAGDDHTLFADVDDATGIIRGQKLRMAGYPVGEVVEVKSADNGRRARLELRIDEDRAWPLPASTTFTLRWGGTVSYVKRYIAVTPGPAGGATYGGGDTIAPKAFKVPVEFDSLMNAFTPDVRRDLKTFVDRGGATFETAGPWLRKTVKDAPAALQQADTVLTQLNSTESRLTTLIASTSRVVGAIRSADPTVEQAVSGAGQTLAATAASTAALRETLARAPGSFANIRTTLGQADRTLDLAGDVTTRLAPGVRELRRTVSPLNSLLRTVVDVGPTARATLATARRGAPDVSRLLRRATTLLPQVTSIGRQATPQLDCIRPYSPELAALVTNWAGFISSVDGRDHYVRINPAAIPWAPTNVQGQSTASSAKLFPGMRMGMPRPPGYAADQPWFQPQCEVTADSIDPDKDIEARPGQTFTPPPLAGERGRKGTGR